MAEGRQVDALGSQDSFRFEGFRFDLAAGGLFRTNGSGVAEPIALGSRALALLALFVERPGQLVSKDEIFAAAWPGVMVGENNLVMQISALRRVLDDARPGSSCIQTVAGRGYRFVLPVTRLGPEAAPAAEGGTSIVNGAHWPRPEVVKSPDGNRPAAPLRRRWRRAGIIAASALGLLLIAAIGWHSFLPQRIDATGSVPRLSIVVLPFANFSNDPDQQYFADGITDDLTTDLSRVTDMSVIARNTAFTYRNKPIDAKQIGSELGVRYLLEGSVQRSGDQVRVNAQLIDAETDVHLWAERFNGDTHDLFGLQNDITSRIAVALNLEMLAAEADRPTNHPDAVDYILRGRAALLRPISRGSFAQAISFYERALAVDPKSVEAQSRLAATLASRVLDLMTASSKADIERAKELSEQALAASPRSPLAHYAKGQALRAQRRFVEAIPEYEAVLASDRNWVTAMFALGQCKMYAGSIEETIPLVERAIRLSPRDPGFAVWYWQIGMVHLLQSRTDEAIIWLEKARTANPELSYVHAGLAAAYGLKDEIERAAAELAEARRLTGEGSWSSIAAQGFPSWGVPKFRALAEDTYIAGLRKAGLPEE
jgi:TolB-like protein/DNA-binding winged helix-turn-helix (wHTH) protein